MSEAVTSIRIAGIGGMGVLTSTLVLAETLFRQGWDVKKAEVHGMSQRGGSVCSDVRFGARVLSPMIPAGGVDFLVLFEEGQFPLYAGDCADRTVILRPAQIETGRLANRKTLNMAMLGLLSRHLDVPPGAWMEVIRARFPEPHRAANEAAFMLGRQSAGA
jgi:indolepyruvate ferredoxin oxidoreductase, beta subunit